MLLVDGVEVPSTRRSASKRSTGLRALSAADSAVRCARSSSPRSLPRWDGSLVESPTEPAGSDVAVRAWVIRSTAFSSRASAKALLAPSGRCGRARSRQLQAAGRSAGAPSEGNTGGPFRLTRVSGSPRTVTEITDAGNPDYRSLSSASPRASRRSLSCCATRSERRSRRSHTCTPSGRGQATRSRSTSNPGATRCLTSSATEKGVDNASRGAHTEFRVR